MTESRLRAAAVIGTICFLLTGCSPDAEKRNHETVRYVLSYAENQAEDHPAALGARLFARLVEERTDGRIQIIVYDNAELGDEESVMEQIRYGGIDFARVSVMTLGELIPRLNVLQLPYLYEDAEHMWRVLDGEIGNELMQEFDDFGMVALSWYDAGSRNFYTVDRPIRKLEDVEGLRIRVAESELMERMMWELGAEPVPIVYSEVYSALETGIIDGAENNWPSYESAGHYRVAGYMTLDGHNRIPEAQMVSSATWEKLSEKDKEMIRQCARESAEYQRRLWEERETQARLRCEQEGCEVTELCDEEMERFREAVESVYEAFGEGEDELIERIIEEGSAH